MQIRSARERLLQTALFEIIGVAIFAPITALFAGADMSLSIALLIILSAVAMTVTGIFNYAFDYIEARYWQRVASDRTFGWRAIHATMLELCIAVFTIPIIKHWFSMGWVEAVVADLLLMLAYAGYSFVFFYCYDRARPVTPKPAATDADGDCLADREMTLADWA